MTAVNIAIAPDGQTAFVLTDSALYDGSNGSFAQWASKTRTIPHARMAVACRGIANYVNTAFILASCYGSLDEAAFSLKDDLNRILDVAYRKKGADSLPASLRRDSHAETLLTAHEAVEGDGLEMFLTGWSDHGKRMVGLRATYWSEDAFALEESPIWLAPMPPAEKLAAVQFPPALDQIQADKDALPKGLLRAMHLQRRWCLDGRAASIGEGQEPKHECIGGAADLTIIERDQITQRIVHRWPDEVGKVIGAT